MSQPALKSLTFIVVLVFASAAWTQDGSENGISSHETKNHIGEFAFVYIKDEYRKELPVEPESFVDRKACVYGKIAKDNGLRQVIALVRTFQIAVEGIELASN